MLQIDLAREDVNLITIYVCPAGGQALAHADVAPPVESLAWKAPPSVPRAWRKTQQKCVEYTKKNMVYAYDVATDGQRLTVHRVLDEQRAGRLRIVYGAEDVLPAHRFPCAREMDDVAYVERDVYKVGHRVSFVVDRFKDGGDYVAYFKYTHSPQVDAPRMLAALNEAVAGVR